MRRRSRRPRASARRGLRPRDERTLPPPPRAAPRLNLPRLTETEHCSPAPAPPADSRTPFLGMRAASGAAPGTLLRTALRAAAAAMAPFASPSSPPRVMLVTDLDGTLVATDDPSHASLRRFNALWTEHCAHDCRLVYCTGRSRAKYLQLRVRARARRRGGHRIAAAFAVCGGGRWALRWRRPRGAARGAAAGAGCAHLQRGHRDLPARGGGHARRALGAGARAQRAQRNPRARAPLHAGCRRARAARRL
jgi:hypothetical protein